MHLFKRFIFEIELPFIFEKVEKSLSPEFSEGVTFTEKNNVIDCSIIDKISVGSVRPKYGQYS